MRMQYMAQEHGRNLHADRKELDGIKRELSNLAYAGHQGPAHQGHQGYVGQQPFVSHSGGGSLVDHLAAQPSAQVGWHNNPPSSGGLLANAGTPNSAGLSNHPLQPGNTVAFPTSNYDSELTRLVQERDDLLRSGIYKEGDSIVQQLNSRIEQLAMGRDASKWL